ncbi:glycosyltransferase [Thermoflexus sp.]|uniref:glycosyltransferase n=1 Tax=Thermoflexus sp. TaxID=1969742 RepID=UPI0025DF9AFE|nr:glycosyltransferase [Thermoflexus sp.]MDW8181037.1 glycosyltransferase [Anaerolineae bacterium]MCS6964317.1 glycosyltransferase [Thermoflexus sp.]MCS7351579.1 glycosyltransferase [Thermoflexus sp.]MCX7689242.1 glycosyltransferase [Thermoflexus sp.]MDW8183778.1 glycosyltransferase [Anaerolineae bacterium]
MRVIHLYKDYFPILGGIENHIRALAKAQVRLGLEVIVLVTSPTRKTIELLDGSVRVLKASRWLTVASTPLSPVFFLYARRLLPQCDLVHLHHPYPPAEIAYLLSGGSTPAVLTYHSDIVRQRLSGRLYRPWLYRVLARVARILVTSPIYLETSPHLRAFRDKCRVVPLGIDVARFLSVSAEAARALRSSWCPASHRPHVLFVGRLRYYKGIDTLLYALARLPDIHATIVGTGPMERAWRTLARNLQLLDRVHFLGEVSDSELPLVYHAADLFVLPANTRAEAFGTVLLEAMAAGLPVIATEIGTGTTWVVGEAGWMVPPRDPVALAEAIREAFNQPGAARARGRQGQERVRREFTVEKMAQSVLEIYEEVLHQATPQSASPNP